MPFSISSDENVRIYLYLSEARALRENNIKIISEAGLAGFSTVVVTTNFPASVLEKLYSQKGIDTEKVFFIDAITKYSLGSVPESNGHSLYLNNPSDLTGMGIAVSEVLRNVAGKKTVVLFDSVSTMLIYLPSGEISKFIHFISNKIRLSGVSGVLLAAEKGIDPMLMTQLTSFVDEIVEADDPVLSSKG